MELYTSRFAYGPVAPPDGYRRVELFYRAARVAPESPAAKRARRALKLAEHVPDMLRYRRAARAADVVHFQWLAVQQLDGRLLPRPHRRAWALRLAHDVLPREASRRRRERRSGACTTASTRSSCTPSMAARGSRTSWASIRRAST